MRIIPVVCIIGLSCSITSAQLSSIDCGIRQRLLEQAVNLVPRFAVSDTDAAARAVLTSDGACSLPPVSASEPTTASATTESVMPSRSSLSSLALTFHVSASVHSGIPNASSHETVRPISYRQSRSFDFEELPLLGSPSNPLPSIESALTTARAARRLCVAAVASSFPGMHPLTLLQRCNATLMLASGRHRLAATVVLNASDSYISIVSTAPPPSGAIVTGAAQISPAWGVSAAAVESQSRLDRWTALVSGIGHLWPLFAAYDASTEGADGSTLGALLWGARQPNGRPDDIQPVNYGAAAGGISSSGLAYPCTSPFTTIQIDAPKRNASPPVFPIFGRDYDPRNPPIGYVWLHAGSAGTVDSACAFESETNWWNQTVPAGFYWNATGGSTPQGWPITPFQWQFGWPVGEVFGVSVRMLHGSLWGSHRFVAGSIDNNAGSITFSGGGWQSVSRASSINGNSFYVEGPCYLLDDLGEFCADPVDRGALAGAIASLKAARNADLLRMKAAGMPPPNTSVLSDPPSRVWPQLPIETDLMLGTVTAVGAMPPSKVDIPYLETLFSVQSATGVSLVDVTFQRTKESSWESWRVPSPGDWSVRMAAAVELRSATQPSIVGCVFEDLLSNGILIAQKTVGARISNSIFRRIGETAIVIVGDLALDNGINAPVPDDIVIDHIVARHVGTISKQASAVFMATSCGVAITNSVLFDGPRAGININDGYCGSKVIQKNILFSWVRETQDHGPINTWDRSMYLSSSTPDPTIPMWNRVDRNLIYNGPGDDRNLGNLFPGVDNDDGSSFYDISHNIMISGGCKNFLGNDKRWHGNLIVYPNTDDHGSCLTHWAGSMSYYGNNTCFSNSDWPIAMWQTTMGACEYDWRKADARSFLPMMDTNSYYTGSGRYWMGCNASYAFTLAQLNDLGIESGSTVRGALSVRGQLQVVDDYIAGIGWSQ